MNSAPPLPLPPQTKQPLTTITVIIPLQYPLEEMVLQNLRTNLGIFAMRITHPVRFDIILYTNTNSSYPSLASTFLSSLETYIQTTLGIPETAVMFTCIAIQDTLPLTRFLYKYVYPYKIKSSSYVCILYDIVQCHPLFSLSSAVDAYKQSSLTVLTPSATTLFPPVITLSDMLQNGPVGDGYIRVVPRINIGYLLMDIIAYRKLYSQLGGERTNLEDILATPSHFKLGVMDGFPMSVLPVSLYRSLPSLKEEPSFQTVPSLLSMNYQLQLPNALSLSSEPLCSVLSTSERLETNAKCHDYPYYDWYDYHRHWWEYPDYLYWYHRPYGLRSIGEPVEPPKKGSLVPQPPFNKTNKSHIQFDMCCCQCHHSHEGHFIPCLLSIPPPMSVSEIPTDKTVLNIEPTYKNIKGNHRFNAIVYDACYNPITVRIDSPYLLKL